MTCKTCVQIFITVSALWLMVLVLPGIAAADECAANVEHITYSARNLPLQIVFFDTILECVDLVVDNFTFNNTFPITIDAFDDKGQTMRSDALVLFNATNGPNGANVANICLWSNEAANGASTCSDMGTVTKLPFVGEPESLRFSITRNWNITLISGTVTQGNKACMPFGDKCSDVGMIATPEPGTLPLWVTGLLGFAVGLRRRVLRAMRDVAEMARQRICQTVGHAGLTAVVLVFVIAVAVQSRGQEISTQGVLTPDAPITINDIFAEIGTKMPEFGGMFIDAEKDTLYVYLTRGGQELTPRLNQAFDDVLGPYRPQQSRFVILPGRYSFVELKHWHDHMTLPVLAIRGTVLTEIDHAKNRLKVGVETLALEPDIALVLAEVGVPREAVNIEETPPAVKEVLSGPIEPPFQDIQSTSDSVSDADTCTPAPCTLRGKIRRLVGGIQIQANGMGDTCTLSVTVEYGLLRPSGIVTDSHCTNRQGGIMNPSLPAPMAEVEPTTFFQPTKGVPANQIAVEMIDPCYWDPSTFPPSYPQRNVPSAGDAPCMSPPNNPPFPLWCPRGHPCRLSDSAFARFQTVTGGDTTYRLGFIARPAVVNASNPPGARCTLATCNINWNGTDTFRIAAEGIVMVGEPITKVGRSTGRTQGIVTDVCVNIDSGPEVIICANFGNPNKTIGGKSGYWSLGGDSGSPVFECMDKRNPAKPIACDDANAKCGTVPNACDVKIVGTHFLRGGGFSPIGSRNNPSATGLQNGAHELGSFFKCALGMLGC